MVIQVFLEAVVETEHLVALSTSPSASTRLTSKSFFSFSEASSLFFSHTKMQTTGPSRWKVVWVALEKEKKMSLFCFLSETQRLPSLPTLTEEMEAMVVWVAWEEMEPQDILEWMPPASLQEQTAAQEVLSLSFFIITFHLRLSFSFCESS
jgi:hypothetical protein